MAFSGQNPLKFLLEKDRTIASVMQEVADAYIEIQQQMHEDLANRVVSAFSKAEKK